MTTLWAAEGGLLWGVQNKSGEDTHRKSSLWLEGGEWHLPSVALNVPGRGSEPVPCPPALGHGSSPYFWDSTHCSCLTVRGELGHPQLHLPCPCPMVHPSPGTGIPRLSCWSLGVCSALTFGKLFSWEGTLCPISAFNLEVNADGDEVGEFPHTPAEGGREGGRVWGGEYPEEWEKWGDMGRLGWSCVHNAMS